MMRVFFAALGATLLAACNPAPECVDNGQCGDMQACVQEQCQDVDCLSSTDCTLHEFCDTRAWTCRTGCAADDDCKAGETCADDHTCRSYGCRNTTLDCPVGRTCVEGQCKEWPEPLCDICDPMEEYLGFEPCGPSASCWLLYGGPDVGFCFPDCDPDAAEPCPAGFDCSADDPEVPNGPHSCVAWCPTLLQNGWL